MRASLFTAAATLVLAASACGVDGDDGDDGDHVARDPGTSSSSVPPPVVVPDGPVRTVGLATVMDTGSPELCLGDVAESYPPQCSGPPLTGWDWGAHHGSYDEQGEVRWGTYALTGTWDGAAFTATDAVPGALYDPAMPTPTPTPVPTTAYDESELAGIAADLRGADGVLGASPVEGHVLLDAYYDDGTLQDWADQTYDAGVVVVSSALVDAD
ncbi:hypothetical protein G5V58_01455 [Nocardioides anomalus]|uniref:Uncharacterized protein n=1 Tax=Nocardioides anomalus TaxID=2712223 RepID=A0A6G6W8R0_9ACTN|nr:hypothetical protein [Nocardioides anomalus]QIG41614.1 hypothetical protein G5V58_01455 [Nocardioides anomalus]